MEKLRNLREHPRVKQLVDARNLGLYVFGIIVLSISWSGIKVIQTNYGLQKQIATLEQEVAIQQLENANMALRNQYYESDQFLELAARRQFGLGNPGETLLLVPKEVALAHSVPIPEELKKTTKKDVDLGKPGYQKNLEAWIDFFGHKQAID